MPVAVDKGWSLEEVPDLKLSSSSLSSSLSEYGTRKIAHSSAKRNRQSIVALPSEDKVCILLDGVNLVKTLPFWSSYNDGDGQEKAAIDCVCISERADTSEVFVVAAAKDCVVVWSTISTIASGKGKWQIHSKIHVGQGRISSIDMQRDLLLIGSERCVTLWTLSSESRQIWTRRWRLRTPKRVLQSVFSPDESSFAVLLENDRRVCLWRLPRGTASSKPEASCSLTHSRVVKQMSWRTEPEQAGPTNAIITRTIDGVVRLWTSVIDEPNSMRIWSTIDPSAMTSSETEEAQACHYLDAFNMYTILRSSLQWLQRDLQMAELGVGVNLEDQERILDLKRSRARRLEHLVTETPDMFALLQSDGTLVIRALANVDRRPPTLCQSFVVLKMASQIAIKSSLVSNITAHPLSTSASSDCYSPTGLLYLALYNGDIIKYRITPSLLFDGLGQGLAKIDENCDAPTMTSLQSNSTRVVSDGMLAIATQSVEQDWSVTIHDTRSSTFSTSAESIFKVKSPVIDLAWSPCSTSSPSMLAVACESVVYILCPRRVTYFDRLRHLNRVPRWTVLAKVDLTTLGRLIITGIVWQSDYSLAVAATNLVLRFSGALQSRELSSSHLVYLARQQAGSLSDHDPEVIFQCLLWNKIGAALDIFTNLASAIDNMIPSEALQVKCMQWEQIEISESKWRPQKNQDTKSTVLDAADEKGEERAGSVARLTQLLERLRGDTISCFSSSGQARLADILETTLTLQQHSSLLDVGAIRYFASISYTSTMKEKETLALDYKSFVWALHSKTQERLLQNLDVFYDGKMDWAVAKRCGIFLWLQSHEDLINRAEQVARQQFSGQDERDPTACSLLYYALRKQKLVANLWRQAFWHKDQKKMLSFLNNDFSQSRWQAAAFKNAFALLSQRRFEMAASFFLLGGGLRDAVNVCTKNLNDICLGITIARLYECGTNGPVFCDLLRKDVLQEALDSDNRWLAHWALSMLGKKDQAMQVLCRPMQTLEFASSLRLNLLKEPLLTYEDAEVAMLFSHRLEHQPLPSSLPAGIEASLVLHAHRTLCEDGLDGLGLAVLRTLKLNSTLESKITAKEQSVSRSIKTIIEPKQDKVAAKVKVASLIQAAKPESSKQAEMSFDVNSFNF